MSCLFDSLSSFYPQISSFQMRNQIVHYLSTNPQLGGAKVSDVIRWESNKPFQIYLRQMQRSSQWGGAIEIKAFCDLFKTNVRVFSLPNRRHIDFFSETKTPKWIKIKWNGVHYTPH